MNILSTSFGSVLLLEPRVFGDSRGYFFESFNERRFRELTGCEFHFVQDNESLSAKGVLRGMHYQLPPKAQGKLVRVVRGAVLDVVVDIRPDSETKGQWAAFELSEENHHQVWIPPGFAHGFLTLRDQTVFQYKVTDWWSPEHERCLAWDDPAVGVNWRLTHPPVVSEKDQKGDTLQATLDALAVYRNLS